MKYFLLGLIKTYQMIPLPIHNSCRYRPTCSQYGIEAIIRYGSIKGSLLTIKRILRCNPFGGYGFDPVPLKEEKCEKIY